jgi:hypothetical protein
VEHLSAFTMCFVCLRSTIFSCHLFLSYQRVTQNLDSPDLKVSAEPKGRVGNYLLYGGSHASRMPILCYARAH